MKDNNEELLKRISDLEREISELKNSYSGFDKTFKEHQHSKRDDSAKMREGSINLKNGGYFTTCGGNFGGGAVFLGVNYQTEGLLLNQANIVTGEGLYKYDSLFKTPTGETDQSPFASLVLLKQKYSGGGAYSDDAFLYAYNDSYMLAPENLTIKSGDTTISHYSFNFENKNLANYILTLRVNGVDYGFLISSNTKNSITFTPASTIDGTISYVFIYKPVYLGSTAGTFKRILLQEGVRFGLGTTANGQNGLLYMDSSGNLTFRNPAGTETILGGGGVLNVQVFTSSGTFTIPSGVRYFDVEVVGGGGGGGGAYSGNPTFGNGGGGGGYCRKFKLDLNGVSSVSVTVGSGGTAGTAASNGGNGGNSSFGSYLTAYGGGGGGSNGQSGGNTGTGGSASGGDININGQNGTYGYCWSYGGSSWVYSGIGGSSFWGIGGYAARGQQNGNSGIGYGAGGSGGCSVSYGGNVNGGAGTQGIVIVRWISSS